MSQTIFEPGSISLPVFGPHDLALLADGPFHEQPGDAQRVVRRMAPHRRSSCCEACASA